MKRPFFCGALFALLALSHLQSAPLRIALYDDAGSMGKGVPMVTEVLGHRDDLTLTQLSAEQIQQGALKGYDAVCFTGGSGHKQADALGETGRTEVHNFVEAGGGYVGICAGSYLACSNFPWSLKIINAQTISQKWRRGKGDVQVELTAEGGKILKGSTAPVTCLYDNGPVMEPAHNEALPPYQPLAYFRTELAENDTPVGVMVNSPAIISGICGKGRVICFSPHPEQTEGLHDLVLHAALWVAAKN